MRPWLKLTFQVSYYILQFYLIIAIVAYPLSYWDRLGSLIVLFSGLLFTNYCFYRVFQYDSTVIMKQCGLFRFCYSQGLFAITANRRSQLQHEKRDETNSTD